MFTAYSAPFAAAADQVTESDIETMIRNGT